MTFLPTLLAIQLIIKLEREGKRNKNKTSEWLLGNHMYFPMLPFNQEAIEDVDPPLSPFLLLSCSKYTVWSLAGRFSLKWSDTAAVTTT